MNTPRPAAQLVLVWVFGWAREKSQNIVKSERFLNETLNPQPPEGGIDSVLTIGTGNDDLQVRTRSMSLFEDLAA